MSKIIFASFILLLAGLCQASLLNDHFDSTLRLLQKPNCTEELTKLNNPEAGDDMTTMNDEEKCNYQIKDSRKKMRNAGKLMQYCVGHEVFGKAKDEARSYHMVFKDMTNCTYKS